MATETAGPGRGRTVPDTDAHFIALRNITVNYGNHVAVDSVSIEVEKGSHLSLLGPSGCGKTTLLRCIAGFETPTEGEIEIDGRIVFSKALGINVPIEDRNLSMMFQSYAIWPHMTVARNVGYGLRLRRQPKAAVRQKVVELLDMVGMAEYADTPATNLSGGQQQRVALARSYAHGPLALLLDEPLSNLDARLREKMREDLVEMQHALGMTTVYVTHDQEEAMSLSSRVVVLAEGRVVQSAPPEEIYNHPRNAFVADFVGAANIVEGRITPNGDGYLLMSGNAQIQCGVLPRDASALGERANAAVRTVHPKLMPLDRADLSDRNTWRAVVRARTFLGDNITYRVDWPGEPQLRITTDSTEDYEVGSHVAVCIPPKRVVLLES